MPELAAAFAVGSLVSLLLGFAFTITQLSKYKSNDYRTLQANLAKIDLRWNDLEASVSPRELTSEGLEAEAIRKAGRKQLVEEYKKARTTYTIFTVGAMAFSWLGALFLIIMWVSVKKLIKSRLERALFQSELTEKDLPKEQVIQHWELLKNFD